ncbi:MAG: PAS domain S-box protein [Bacteroidota bacterium]
MADRKTSRILLLIFLISSGVLLLLGHIFFDLQKDEITNKIYSELQAISLLKEKQIKDWYKERLEIADFIRNDQSLISNLKLVFAGKGSSKKIINWLEAFSKDSNFSQAAFFDPQLKTYIAAKTFAIPRDAGISLIAKAVSKRDIMISDIHLTSKENIPHIDIAVPLFDLETSKQPLVGILLIRIEPHKFLFPLIQKWVGNAKSGETSLVSRDVDSVVFLNELRFKENQPLNFKLSIKDTSLPAARLLLGKKGFFEGKDYRGIAVLSYLNKIEGTNWFLVTKEDKEEIYAPLRFRAFITGIVVVLLIVIVAVILILVWKHEQKKFYQAKYELEAEKKLLTKHVELLIKHANDMIFMIDENRRIVDVNDKVLSVYGYSKEEILNMRADDFSTPESAPSTRDSFVRAEIEGGIVHETMHRRKDGTTFPVEASTRCIEIDGKKFFQGIVRDISERKTKDIKIQRLNRVYATLSDINQLIVREHNREILLERSCCIAIEKGKFLLAWIGILDKESGWINVTSFCGSAKDYLNQIKVSINSGIPEGMGPTGTAMRKQRYDVCNDVESETRMFPWRDKQLSFGIRSSVALPLIVHGETFGVFSVYSDEKGFFDTEEIALLDELSKDISFALEHIEDEEKRKIAEEENARFLKVLQESLNEIYIFDSNDLKFEFVNYGALKNLGYTLDEIKNLTPLDLKPEFDINSFRNLITPLLKKENMNLVFETIHKRKNGSLYPVEVHLQLVEHGSNKTFVAIILDITKRRESDDKIRKLTRGIEQSPATIIITDINGKIEYVNPKFTETTGYTFEEAIGKNPRILKSGEKSPEEYQLMWQTIKAGKEWRGEFHNKKKKGELYWEQASISPIKDSQGNITHFIAVKEDITEMKKLIEELFSAKDRAEHANKLKSEFLAQMSHEIRSPINITMNFSNLLKDALDEKLTPEIEEYFEGIHTAGKRLIRTIGLILNASEIQVGSYEPTWTKLDLMRDVFDSIRTEYSITAKMKGLNFNIYCNTSETTVLGDRYSLNQIFVNLIDNAIKYTRAGEVELTINRNQDQCIEVIVKDTGIGMSEEFMANMFEPFMQEERGYSRRYEGNGLGLSLVKKYCELNKAKISVQSEKGKGSKFTVTFEKEPTMS